MHSSQKTGTWHHARPHGSTREWWELGIGAFIGVCFCRKKQVRQGKQAWDQLVGVISRVL